ncbi:anti-sigma-V factor rsiV [Clostridioides difficile]|nr:anti-sigma-V factor rsiV [Clostridioides difficile]
MTSKERLDKLKEEYHKIPIPKKLDTIINHEKIENIYYEKNKKVNRLRFKVAIAFACMFTVLVNISPVFADNFSKIPIIGGIVEVITIKNYSLKSENYEAKIDIPKIQGLKDKNLEKRLNSSFMEDGKRLYNEFQQRMEKIELSKNKGHRSLSLSYSVKNNSKDFLSIEMTKNEIEASSYVSKIHYNVDKKRQIVLTLPMLFKDDKYIKVISDNIKEQMRAQIKNDSTKSYFIDQEKDLSAEDFKTINKYQDFYINKDGNLIISFDEYEVAPGYMGAVEFVIPYEVIKYL